MIANPAATVTDAVADFLSSTPSVEQLIAWRLPANWQERAADLLSKVKDDTASAEELAEVDEFRQINHLMILVKARAQLRQRASG